MKRTDLLAMLTDVATGKLTIESLIEKVQTSGKATHWTPIDDVKKFKGLDDGIYLIENGKVSFAPITINGHRFAIYYKGNGKKKEA